MLFKETTYNNNIYKQIKSEIVQIDKYNSLYIIL